MANLGFKLLKLFASGATNNGQFGSAQIGTKVESTDPDVLQALAAWESGWNEAVISGQRLPTLEEMQAVQYVLSYGVTGQQQWGIWPWDASQTFGIGSLTNVGGVIYKSLQNDNTGNAPDSSPLWWEEAIPGAEFTVWAGTAGGTANAIELTPDPALTEYAAGDFYFFLSSSASTSGTVTVDISGLGTKNIKKIGATGKTDLAVGDIQSGVIVGIVYDGTDFVIINSRTYSQGASISAAGTLNLNNATGDYVAITGTTTVTAITLAQGVERTCRAADPFILTNGASLILPTGANITTEAGDVFTVRGEASGVVRVTAYMRASGEPILPVRLAESVLTSAFTTTSSSFVDTGLSITVSLSANEKILLAFMLNTGSANPCSSFFVLTDGSDNILVRGDSAGSRSRTHLFKRISSATFAQMAYGDSGMFVYTAPSAGSYTFKVRARTDGDIFLNRSSTDTDSATYGRGVSTLIGMVVR